MATPAQHPFTGYNLYIVHHAKMQRKMACLVQPGKKSENPHRTTISYARYVMAVHIGRRLEKHEEVDHIDNDRTNDDIANLQILSRVENRAKQARIQAPAAMREMTCDFCGAAFSRRRNQTNHAKPNQKRHYCGKPCAHRATSIRMRSRPFPGKSNRTALGTNLSYR